MSVDNIVKASFVFGKTATTRSLHQWDYGQVLQFEGIDLPAAYTVHFANQPMSGDAKTQVGGADGVYIPDEYLTTGLPVYAWVYLHTGADDGETVYSVTIPVTKRPKPTEEPPTPQQQGAIDTAIAALNEGVETVEGIAEAIPATIDAALEAAKDSGEFDGPPGRDAELRADRVTSLTETPLSGGAIVEAVGIPIYVSDVSQYAAYGLTEAGWYTFARIAAPAGLTVGAATAVTGAVGYIATAGGSYVDVAVRFGVTAMSQAVTVSWDGQRAETFVFRATDLAVRNLDYRTTFYLYDLAPFVTWTYALTTDATFVANKNYYTKDGDTYTLAEVTAGAAVTANTYYTHSKVRFEGMTRNVTYKFDEIIDCPIEIALPEVEDDGYGAWFEIQLRYNGSYSCTLLPPEGVKIGTVSTQSQTAGINVIDLQYTGVGGVAMWSLLNTHSNIPT